MVNYWYFKIGANDQYFEQVKQRCLDTESIGIGYDLQLNYLLSTLEERKIHWLNKNTNLTNRQIQDKERYFQTFTQKMKKGDIVFLCKGLNEILYICELADNKYYYLDNDPNDLRHRRHIINIKPFECIAPKKMVGTIYSV